MKMKLGELRANYYKATGQASELSRSTNYSLIAICWILCGENFKNLNQYLWVLIFLSLSLASDYLQYLYKSLMCTYYYKKREKEEQKKGAVTDETEVDDYPEWIPYITIFFYTLKYVFTLIAVIILIIQLFKKIALWN